MPYTISAADLPDQKLTTGGHLRNQQPLTMRNVEKVLTLMGLDVAFNVMLNRVEVIGEGIDQSERSQELATQGIRDCLMMCDIIRGNVPKMLELIGRKHCYHSMQDWILSKPWDGEKRINQLAATVQAYGDLWPTYLLRWLIQCVEAVRGWQDGADRTLGNVLTFIGPHTVDRAKWFEALAPGFALTGVELNLYSTQGRADVNRCLTFPLVCLSHIDLATNIAQVRNLHSFFAKRMDNTGRYQRADSVYIPRMTCFAGSVTDATHLAAHEATRNFWPVDTGTSRMHYAHSLDVQQIWAEANHLWVEGEPWALTASEENRRSTTSDQFLLMSGSVEKISKHFAQHKSCWRQYAALKKTEILDVCGIGWQTRTDQNATNHWLKSNLGPARTIQGISKAWPFPVTIEQHDRLRPEQKLRSGKARDYARAFNVSIPYIRRVK